VEDGTDVDRVEGAEVEAKLDLVKAPLTDELEMDAPYKFQGTLMFVTYNQCCVKDYKQFYGYLRSHLEAQMPLIDGEGEERLKVEVFGAQELHADGNPHYHVLIRFQCRVHWLDTYSRLSVPFVEDGVKRLVSTSIRIGHPRRGQRQSAYLDSVQAYITKETGLGKDYVFGQRIMVPVNAGEARKERENEVARMALRLVGRRETKDLLEREEPAKCIWNRVNLDRVLKSKAPDPRAPYVVDYEQKPYRPTARMGRWLRENFGGQRRKGRPTCLVLVGDSRYGKTDWAMSFGNPVMMVNKLVFDEMTTECSHIVLNDMAFNTFREWREFMGCQNSVAITGKYRDEVLLPWGKPAIITCNRDNNPLRVKKMADYFRQSKGVVEYLVKPLY
jgi:hypothetical protein